MKNPIDYLLRETSLNKETTPLDTTIVLLHTFALILLEWRYWLITIIASSAYLTALILISILTVI